MSNLYGERDAWALDEAGNYYMRHVVAMTHEGLDSKSAIAAELGHRDMQIDALLEAQQDTDRLVRELDVLLNGEAGAAKQASLCDIVAQVANDGVVTKTQCAMLLAALQKYEEAFDLLFGQCCANGIFDAWGKRVNCATLNEAHELARKVIKQAAARG